MRKIKFRGVDMFSNEWVYGDCLHLSPDHVSIVMDYGGDRRVIYNSSLGQVTDFVDVDGAEIYEGDILEVISLTNPEKVERVEVEFLNGSFRLMPSYLDLDFYCFNDNVMQCRVIGNSYFGLDRRD